MADPNPGATPDLVDHLDGQPVVLDMATPFVCLGTLAGGDHRYLRLVDADIHDLRDTNTTRERYVLEAARHGIQPNRREAFVRRDEVVSLSPLAAVLH